MSCDAVCSRDKSSHVTAGTLRGGISSISKSSLCPSVANLKLMVPEQAEDAALNQHTEGAEGAFKVVTFFSYFWL